MAKYTIKIKALAWVETEVEVQTYQGDDMALALAEEKVDGDYLYLDWVNNGGIHLVEGMDIVYKEPEEGDDE